MRFNEFMHPRNLYLKKPPDFKQLAIQDLAFRQHSSQDLVGKVSVNFKDPSAVRSLTCALLRQDFGLEVDLPLNRIIPPVPGRLNYILWVEDLLSNVNTGSNVHGIDIGCGASCIFPLLGAKKNGWQFLATEIDTLNIEIAKKNVNQNGLSDKIKVIDVRNNEDILITVITDEQEQFDFCMCNPPFYKSVEEQQASLSMHGTPKTVNTASACEMVTEGGERAFVSKIIEDSVCLQTKIKIYSSMVGKKSSLKIIKDKLRKHGITNTCTTEFCQGKTLRWGIAWSFCTDFVLQTSTCLSQKLKKTKRLPQLVYVVPCDAVGVAEYTLPCVKNRLFSILCELKVIVDETLHHKEGSWVVTAVENTWSNQRFKRRKKKFEQQLAKKAKLDDNKHENPATSHELGSSSVPTLSDSAVVSLTNRPKSEDAINETKDEKASAVKGEANANAPTSSSKVETDEYLFRCTILVKSLGNGDIVVELQWLEGKSKDFLHQVLQYIKNQLSIRCTKQNQEGSDVDMPKDQNE